MSLFMGTITKMKREGECWWVRFLISLDHLSYNSSHFYQRLGQGENKNVIQRNTSFLRKTRTQFLIILIRRNENRYIDRDIIFFLFVASFIVCT